MFGLRPIRHGQLAPTVSFFKKFSQSCCYPFERNISLPAKWCYGAPDPPVNGSAYVNSTGYRYGSVCNGSDPWSSPEWLTGCPYVGVTYTEVGAGRARYELTIYTNSTRADKLFLVVQFDSPVTNIVVSSSFTIPRMSS